jgi:hypothetical protein
MAADLPGLTVDFSVLEDTADFSFLADMAFAAAVWPLEEAVDFSLLVDIEFAAAILLLGGDTFFFSSKSKVPSFDDIAPTDFSDLIDEVESSARIAIALPGFVVERDFSPLKDTADLSALAEVTFAGGNLTGNRLGLDRDSFDLTALMTCFFLRITL